MVGKSLVLGTLLLSACWIDRGQPDDPNDGTTDQPIGIDACPARALDSFALEGLAVDGDVLRVSIGTGGGCERHTWSACWNGVILDSYPEQVDVVLVHDGHGDRCDAYLTTDIQVDISSIRAAVSPSATLHLRGATSAGSITLP